MPAKLQNVTDGIANPDRLRSHGTAGTTGCHESTDNIPGRDVIRGLPYGAFIVRGVDTHRHGCWAASVEEEAGVDDIQIS